MKINKLTLSIGIPAYNEQRTIVRLVKSLMMQKNTRYELDEIIVALDGCTDETESKLKELKLKQLTLMVNKKRQGKAAVLDQIVKKATADALMLVDADITLKDASFIDMLIKPITVGAVDLTTAQIQALKPTTIFSKILDKSNEFKKAIYEDWKNGNNLYTCHGRALAMSKKLYKKMQYKNIIADDAWTYLTTKIENMNYEYVQAAKVYYTLPYTLGDHMKQSMRFYRSQKQLEKHTTKEVVLKEYSIPRTLLVKHLLKSIVKYPISITAYVLLVGYIQIKTMINPKQKSQWEVATSSKL